MAFCGECGSKIEDGAKFCAACGASAPSQTSNDTTQKNSAAAQNDYGAKLKSLNETADTTAEFDADDIKQNKVMAVLSYLGILVLVPILAAKDSRFARYHANQGLVLAIAGIAYGIAYNILSSIILAISRKLYFLTSILGLVSLCFLVLAIIGIINAANGRAKELPIIGKIQILK